MSLPQSSVGSEERRTCSPARAQRPSALRQCLTGLLGLLALQAVSCVSPRLGAGPSSSERLAAVLERSDLVDEERLARELRKLSLRSPGHVPTLVADAALSIETGRTERARALLDTALRREPAHVDATVLAVRIAAAAGDMAGAQRRLDSALLARPDEPLLYESGAALAFLDARYGDALAAIDRAEQLEGAETWSHAYHRGLILEADGRSDLAEAAFRRCDELNPGYEPAARRLRALVTR